MEHTERPPTPSEHPAASAAAIAAAHGKVDRPTPDLAEAIAKGYEPHDIGLRGVFVFLGTLVAALVVVLLAIYAIMMALVDHDRSHDALGTPVSIVRPEQYAPLQPSIGHPTEDWQDMDLMRQYNQAVLTSSGVSPSGRRHIPVDQAIEQALPLLVVRPAVTATPSPAFAPGSMEGTYTGGGPGAVAPTAERAAE